METFTAHEVLRTLANRSLDFDFTVWHWGDAIAIDGLLDASEILGDCRYADHVAKFYRGWLSRPLGWQDHLCPGLGLLRLYVKSGDDSFLEGARRLAALLKSAPRARKTGVPMYRPDLGPVRFNAWVDTVYHEPSFLCELARLTGEDTYYEDSLNVLFTHVAALTSGQGPFLCHAAETVLPTYKGYGWGRGQGWALYGMIDTLQRLPKAHTRYDDVLQHARTFASHILLLQDASGFWRTLIHDRESYLESSTAAFLGGAFYRGVRIGALSEEFATAADRAWSAVTTRVDVSRGDFYGVSAWTIASTAPGDSVALYKTLPTEVNWWGQGSAMRIAAERIFSQKEN